ncbi:hypothetical protein [Luteolibacter sp. Populi]|uniref:hypothetical protein n=1 Tax=Luteolibacter sp. Populi TaxID=3230487 RepID=UPI003466CEE8
MKKLLSAILLGCLLSSCGTIYIKDVIQGDPFERSYKLNFRNAVDEGATAAQAHHMALLVAGEKHTVTWERRERAEQLSEELDREFGTHRDPLEPTLKWD